MNENINLEENIEIKKALKEFEIKSNAEQIQKTPEALKNFETPKMIQLVIKYSGGGIKNEKQAQYVLFGFIILMVIISLFLFLKSSGNGNYPKLDSAAFDKLMKTPPLEIPSIN